MTEEKEKEKEKEKEIERDRENIKEKEDTTNTTSVSSVRSVHYVGYTLMVEDALWLPFKTICTARGRSIKDQLTELILNFVRENAPKHFGSVSIQQIQIEQMNLYQFLLAEEAHTLTSEIKKAIERKANPAYLSELRMKLLDLVKKNPTVTPALAEEIKAALSLLREGGEKR